MNSTPSDVSPTTIGFSCHRCNPSGTESCSESSKSCVCRPWYDGKHCQHCRFSNDFVLAPNGTCIPCPCGGRPMHECFQSRMCSSAHQASAAISSLKEGTAASALFIATLSAIICVAAYVAYRVVRRSKRLRALTLLSSNANVRHPRDADDVEDVTMSDPIDLDDPYWKDDDRLINDDHHERSIDRSTSLFTIPMIDQQPIGSMGAGNRSIASFLTYLQRGASTRMDGGRPPPTPKCVGIPSSTSIPAVLNVDPSTGYDEHGMPKNGMKISSSCSEYYFLSVQGQDEDEDEQAA